MASESGQWRRVRFISALTPHRKEVLVIEERLDVSSLELAGDWEEAEDQLRYRLPDGSAVKPLDAQCQQFEITHSGVLLEARQP